MVKIGISARENGGISSSPDRKLFDLKYADSFVLLTEDTSKCQIFLACLNDSVNRLAMRFALQKCKMLLHDWLCCKLNLVILGGDMGEAHMFNCLNEYISLNGRMPEGISSRIQKALLTFTNLMHL